MIEKDWQRRGLKVQQSLKLTLFLKILMDVEFQYRCGTSLFLNWKLSTERQLIYHKNIDKSGHGKSRIDADQSRIKDGLSRGLCM